VLLRSVETVTGHSNASNISQKDSSIASPTSKTTFSEAGLSGSSIAIALCIVLHHCVLAYTDFLELDHQLRQQQQHLQIQSSTKTFIGSVIYKLFNHTNNTTSDSNGFSSNNNVNNSQSGYVLSMDIYVVLMCTLDFLDPHTVSESLVTQLLEFNNKIEEICVAVKMNAAVLSQNAVELKEVIGMVV